MKNIQLVCVMILVSTTNYPVNLKNCCLAFFCKEKRLHPGNPLRDTEEMLVIPGIAPVIVRASSLQDLSRSNSEDLQNESPWSALQPYDQRSKYAPLEEQQEKLPVVDRRSISDNLDDCGREKTLTPQQDQIKRDQADGWSSNNSLENDLKSSEFHLLVNSQDLIVSPKSDGSWQDVSNDVT